MKKFFIICLCIAFAALSASLCSCKKKMDNYWSVVPTDVDYKATLSYSSQSETGGYLGEWTVMRKDCFICGGQRKVIYVEYKLKNLVTETENINITLMYVNQTVLKLDGETWRNHTGSFGDKWSDVYGDYAHSGSFVYEITHGVTGRDFPQNYKVKGDGYIEYDFKRDNELFRLSDDPYHLLLKYTFDYKETHIREDATIVYGAPEDAIPHLDTITEEMIGLSA